MPENLKQPSPELSHLDVFIGTWKTKCEIIATDESPTVPIEGTDTYEWLDIKLTSTT